MRRLIEPLGTGYFIALYGNLRKNLERALKKFPEFVPAPSTTERCNLYLAKYKELSFYISQGNEKSDPQNIIITVIAREKQNLISKVNQVMKKLHIKEKDVEEERLRFQYNICLEQFFEGNLPKWMTKPI